MDLAEAGVFQGEYNGARKGKGPEGACKGEIVLTDYRLEAG